MRVGEAYAGNGIPEGGPKVVGSLPRRGQLFIMAFEHLLIPIYDFQCTVSLSLDFLNQGAS